MLVFIKLFYLFVRLRIILLGVQHLMLHLMHDLYFIDNLG